MLDILCFVTTIHVSFLFHVIMTLILTMSTARDLLNQMISKIKDKRLKINRRKQTTIKGTVMYIEKALINHRLRVLKVS